MEFFKVDGTWGSGYREMGKFGDEYGGSKFLGAMDVLGMSSEDIDEIKNDLSNLIEKGCFIIYKDNGTATMYFTSEAVEECKNGTSEIDYEMYYPELIGSYNPDEFGCPKDEYAPTKIEESEYNTAKSRAVTALEKEYEAFIKAGESMDEDESDNVMTSPYWEAVQDLAERL